MEDNSLKKHSLGDPEPSSSLPKKPRKPKCQNLNDAEHLQIELMEKLDIFDNYLKTIRPQLDHLVAAFTSLEEQYKEYKRCLKTENVPKYISDKYNTRTKSVNDCKKSVIDATRKANELKKTRKVDKRTVDPVLSIKKREELLNKIKKETEEVEKLNNLVVSKIKAQRSKQTPTIKRQTVKGDEFQRLIQILIRQRALSCWGAEVGIEVSGVGQLDDAVFLNTTDKRCRFFQMKHKENKLESPILATELFKCSFENDEANLADASSSPSLARGAGKKKGPPGLHLLMYFKSFCSIKENHKFENYNIDEVTLVTNRDMVLTDRIKGQALLPLLEQVSEKDECLDFDNKKAQKYRLKVEEAKKLFFEILLKESRKHLYNKINFAKTIVEEFLEKIHIVVNYPDIKELRKLIFNQVFSEDIFSYSNETFTETFLGNNIISFEIQLLQRKNEFTTNEEWEKEVNKMNKFINANKSIGISDSNTRSVLSDTSFNVTFENNIDIYKDVEEFIDGNQHQVLECVGINFKMNNMKVINILQKRTLDKKFSYLFCKYDHLFTADWLLQSFCDGDFSILVVKCKKVTNNEEMILPILLNALNSSRKMIIVSEKENTFTSLKESLRDKYLFKLYKQDGYKCLTQSCKDKIKHMQINFQNRTISFGQLISDSLATIAIDDNCLWDIVNKNNPQITVSDDSSFCSPGYSKEYYIPREFYQSKIKHFNEITHKKTMIIKEESLLEGTTTEGLAHIFILVGDSGVGKSTTLTSIANKIGDSCGKTWVVRVNLRKTFLLKIFKRTINIVSPDDAISCVCKMIFTNETQNILDNNLMKEALKISYKGIFKFVLLLDGFNEVNEELQDKIITLTKTLRDFCNVNQIWITTQNHARVKLETEFEVSSYFLNPLNVEDQINLMARYWRTIYKKNPLVEISYKQLYSDAKDAIQQFKTCVNDVERRLFTENSLNLRMLADILVGTDRKMIEKLKIYDLYEIFVKQKFSVQKIETTPDRPTSHDEEESEPLDYIKDKLFENHVRGILQQFSVKTVLNNHNKTYKRIEDNLPGMDAYETFKTFITSLESELVLSKLGILNLKNHDFDFNHPSFAHFFFCEYLIKNLFNGNTNKLWVLFVLSTSSLQPCRRFLEHALGKLEMSNTKDKEKLKNTLPSSLVTILIQVTRNSAAPFKENLYNVSLFLLRWMNEKDVKRYLENILPKDFESNNDIILNKDKIISYFNTAPKEQSVRWLIQLYQNRNNKVEIKSIVQKVVNSEVNYDKESKYNYYGLISMEQGLEANLQREPEGNLDQGTEYNSNISTNMDQESEGNLDRQSENKQNGLTNRDQESERNSDRESEISPDSSTNMDQKHKKLSFLQYSAPKKKKLLSSRRISSQPSISGMEL